MPVVALGNGRYGWGKSGRVYSGPGAKAKAERQGRAVLATGWREEKRDAKRGPGGTDRSATRRALKASARAETRYVRDLQSVLGRIHEAVEKVATPHLEALSKRGDASAAAPDLGPTFFRKLFVYVKREVGKAYDRMSGEVAKKATETTKLLGLNPVHAGLGGIVEAARDRNIQLVEKAGRVYAGQVRAIFDDPDNFGRRVEDLQGLLEERADVSKSRAELIARDQTLKLNAAITKHQQTSAGVSQYTWDTSQDERVRPMHAELQGELFDWDDPPVTNEDGDTNNPGEDYQCRCVAIPVIPDLDEEETPGEASPDDEA
jgi:SPP1 gp7 family putative phage head morphogenesis protein